MIIHPNDYTFSLQRLLPYMCLGTSFISQFPFDGTAIISLGNYIFLWFRRSSISNIYVCHIVTRRSCSGRTEYLLSILAVDEDWEGSISVRIFFFLFPQQPIPLLNIHPKIWKIAPISFKNAPNTTFALALCFIYYYYFAVDCLLVAFDTLLLLKWVRFMSLTPCTAHTQYVHD